MNGNLIGAVNNPSVPSASGVWDLTETKLAIQQQLWPSLSFSASVLGIGGGGGGGGGATNARGGGGGWWSNAGQCSGRWKGVGRGQGPRR